MQFTSKIVFVIQDCTRGWETFPTQPGDEVDKIWTVQKTSTAFIIGCNGVEVLNYKFSDGFKSTCAARWEGKMVKKIMFDGGDRASDSYQQKLPTGNYIYIATIGGGVQPQKIKLFPKSRVWLIFLKFFDFFVLKFFDFLKFFWFHDLFCFFSLFYFF